MSRSTSFSSQEVSCPNLSALIETLIQEGVGAFVGNRVGFGVTSGAGCGGGLFDIPD